MARWPKDNQAALIRFYGDPGTGEVAEQLVKIVPPFRMYYEGKLVRTISFHKKGQNALIAALEQIWAYYGHDQATIDKFEISKYSGTYNPRRVRGNPDKWSNHAFGAAIDIDAEDNGFGTGKGDLPLPVIAAFKSEGFAWGGDYKGRTDPMHFELCDRGEPLRTFAEWLKFYKCPPSYRAVKLVAAPVPVPIPAPASVAPPAPVIDFAPEPATPKPPAAPLPAIVAQGDQELQNIQRRLLAMKYSPGGLDGIWGGMTAGAISGFITDRKLAMEPPTSIEAYLAIREPLKVELSRAEAEMPSWTRPIAPERKEATPAELAPKLADVDASIKAERLSFWGSVAAAISGVATGIGKFMGEAVEWLNPVKTFIADLPWPVWVGGVLAVSGALFYISTKSGAAKDAATKAFQEGERTS